MPKREMEVLTPQMYYVLLVLHQPMHGYEIMNEITRITNGEITVGAGSLYTLLPKFEKECYIKLVKVENNKKIYQITNLGNKKLQKEKEVEKKVGKETFHITQHKRAMPENCIALL